MNPDMVLDRIIQANPKPVSVETPENVLTRSALLVELDRRSTDMQTQDRPIIDQAMPPTPRRRRWLVPALAGAAITIIAIVVAAALLSSDDQPDVTNDPATVNSEAARVDAAIVTTETFLAAINSGDVDRLISMSNPEATDLVKDRSMWELNAVMTTSGYELEVGACAPSLVTELFVAVACDITFTDPVFAAEGVSALVFPIWVFNDGTTAWRPMQGGDFSAANRDYADYLRTFHTSEYEAVCSPSAYELGSINSDGGLALTGDCAQLYVPLALDVAEWVRDGKPLP